MARYIIDFGVRGFLMTISYFPQDAGYSYTLQHIKEMDADDRAVGGAGLKLKVYRNGQYTTPAIVYFNSRQASRGIKDNKLVFERVSH